jgi:hypothetical protein
MNDSRTVSGHIEVEHEGRFFTAFKLMEKIAHKEQDGERKMEQGDRKYWLSLYVQCVNATYRRLPTNTNPASDW